MLEEPVVSAVGCQPECPAKGRRLGLGKTVDKCQARSYELMERSERELILGLDARAAKNLHGAGGFGRKLQKRGLPDARLTANDQNPAFALARARKQRCDPLPLDLSSNDHANDSPPLAVG